MVPDVADSAVFVLLNEGRPRLPINASSSSFLRFPEPIIAPNTKANELTEIIMIISMTNLPMNYYLGRIYTKTYLVCAGSDKCRINLI